MKALCFFNDKNSLNQWKQNRKCGIRTKWIVIYIIQYLTDSAELEYFAIDLEQIHTLYIIWNLQFLNNVIIIKTKVLLPQA